MHAAILVRPPQTADATALAAVLAAMEAEYGIRLPPDRAEAAAALILSGAPHAQCRLAFHDGAPVGIALFAKLFPGAALTDIIYLKDLYVAPPRQAPRCRPRPAARRGPIRLRPAGNAY
jgi:hypothetical protein